MGPKRKAAAAGTAKSKGKGKAAEGAEEAGSASSCAPAAAPEPAAGKPSDSDVVEEQETTAQEASGSSSRGARSSRRSAGSTLAGPSGTSGSAAANANANAEAGPSMSARAIGEASTSAAGAGAGAAVGIGPATTRNWPRAPSMRQQAVWRRAQRAARYKVATFEQSDESGGGSGSSSDGSDSEDSDGVGGAGGKGAGGKGSDAAAAMGASADVKHAVEEGSASDASAAAARRLAKGKARAFDDDQQPSRAAGQAGAEDEGERAKAPVQRIPARRLVAIEYPGYILTPAERAARQRASGGEAQAGPSGLERALATLSPDPPPLCNPASALDHLAALLERRAEVVECRLGAPYHPPSGAAADGQAFAEGMHEDEDAGGEGGRAAAQAVEKQPHRLAPVESGWKARARELARQAGERPGEVSQARLAALGEKTPFAETEDDAPPLTLDAQIYRHPILGNFVPTNNPVVRIRRRTWRRRKPGTGAGAEKEEDVRKEYVLELVGTAHQTVRFRSLAEYAYEPDVGHVTLAPQDVLAANAPPGLPLRTQKRWEKLRLRSAASPDKAADEGDAEMEDAHGTQGEDMDVDPAIDPQLLDPPAGASKEKGKGKGKGKEKEKARARSDSVVSIPSSVASATRVTLAATMLDDEHGTVLRRKPARERVTTANKTLALHAALMTMNREALRAFRFDPELHENTKEVRVPKKPENAHPVDLSKTVEQVQKEKAAAAKAKHKASDLVLVQKSNLNFIPPARFVKQAPPFPYYFQQNYYSHIVETVLADGTVQRRWANNRSLKGQYVTTFQFALPRQSTTAAQNAGGEDDDEEDELEDEEEQAQADRVAPRSKQRFVLNPAPVPQEPPPAVENQRKEVDDALSARIEALFEEEPVWSRTSLLNQFPDPIERSAIVNNKILIALHAYTITNGPFKGALVRFGYDVRDDPESRFYQRVSFKTYGRQGKNQSKRLMRGFGPGQAEDTAERARSSSRVPEDDAMDVDEPDGADQEEQEEDDADDDQEEQHDGGEGERSLESHVFDGKTILNNTSTFFLKDITDPDIKELIDATGSRAVRDEIDVRTGWYTELQWLLIREVAGLKFRWVSVKGQPVSEQNVRSCIQRHKELYKRLKSGKGGDSAVQGERGEDEEPSYFDDQADAEDDFDEDDFEQQLEKAQQSLNAGGSGGKGKSKAKSRPHAPMVQKPKLHRTGASASKGKGKGKGKAVA